MKKINLDVLIVLLLLIAAAWTRLHVSALPILGALALVPLFGNLIATPRKSTKQPLRAFLEN
ncbi:MAG TPA: hypothetical protein VLK33_16830 [Terriglobales bacterium]|nr:hypothetical protein [Terriglobales bacterium]